MPANKLQTDDKGKNFFWIIVTGEETWIHHYESKSKRQSMKPKQP